jgi:hypothetical protein
MFKDIREKLPGLLDQVKNFMGWSDGEGKVAEQWRKVIASAVWGYAVSLMRDAGYSMADALDLAAASWSKLDAPDDPNVSHPSQEE